MSTPKKKRKNPYFHQYQIAWCEDQIMGSSEYLRKLIDEDIKRKKGFEYLENLQQEEKEKFSKRCSKKKET